MGLCTEAQQGEKQRVKLQSRVQKVAVSQGPRKLPYSAIAAIKEREKPARLAVHDEEVRSATMVLTPSFIPLPVPVAIVQL